MIESILEKKSKELKQFLTQYKTQNMLGHLSFLMTCITNGLAKDSLDKLTSPMRQLYYLAGLLVSDESDGSNEVNYSDEDWIYIVNLLNEIEIEHIHLFLPDNDDEISDEWKKQVLISMPTFLSYFNLGPLNYEEQVIEEILGVYTKVDDFIYKTCGLLTSDFVKFYENLDSWCQYNFKSFNNPQVTPLRDNWQDYSDLKIEISDKAPFEVNELISSSDYKAKYMFIIDPGIKYRFKPSDLAINGLSLDKVNMIISLLSCERCKYDFLYYTSINPIINKPIVKLENGLFQVFEEKRVLHAIYLFLDALCKKDEKINSRLSHHKGNFLENSIVELFTKFLKKKSEIYIGYYIDDCEQDILILYESYMLVIESKAYKNKEPFRNTEKAFKRIKQDFDRSIGYAYHQCKRVEDKMKSGRPFEIKDKDGKIIKTIDPNKYNGSDFYMIVNKESFGQIQTDLSSFIDIEDGYNYPWAVRYEDLEVFILTLIANKKKPSYFFDFLIMREYLHGHIICDDECQICGAYINGDLDVNMAESDNLITFTPKTAEIFDKQYRKGMGFKNEKFWKEKRSGTILFW